MPHNQQKATRFENAAHTKGYLASVFAESPGKAPVAPEKAPFTQGEQGERERYEGYEGHGEREGHGETQAAPAPNGKADACVFERLFAGQIESFHGKRVRPPDRDGVGTLWTIDPNYGQGTYWYFVIDSLMCVAIFDFTSTCNMSFTCAAPDLFCFGSYGKNMVPYFGIDAQAGDRTLLGYAFRQQSYVQHVRANEPLSVCSVTLLAEGVHRMSRICQCDPVMLAGVLSSLDGRASVPGMLNLLEEMRLARPTRTSAHAYYLAKITEACTLLIDWYLRSKAAATPKIRQPDRTALALAERLITDNLDRSVTNEELCRVSCMSESKLASLFKRVEGATPQAWARARKMALARKLLIDTDLPIACIAARVGYDHQGSFTEAFKEAFAMTPLAYRRAFAFPLHPCSEKVKSS